MYMGACSSSLPPPARDRRYAGVPECDSRYQLLAAKDGDVRRLTKSVHVLNPLGVQR